MFTIIVLIALSYTLGSIPFSLLLTKIFCETDIRDIGSGNVGATNVYRINKKLALVALILDVLKAALYLAICKKFGIETLYLSILGMFSVIGHIFPVWIKFKGGKGVATICGVTIILSMPALGVFVTTWIATFLVTRYSSLSSIVAVITTTVYIAITEPLVISIVYVMTSLLVLVKHKSNVCRLIKNKEKRL